MIFTNLDNIEMRLIFTNLDNIEMRLNNMKYVLTKEDSNHV